MAKTSSLPHTPFDESWDLEQYCARACSDMATVLGTLMGELGHGLASPQPEAREKAMTIALGACEQLLHLTHNLRYYTSNMGPGETTDLAASLLETVDRLEKRFEQNAVTFDVHAHTPSVGALHAGALNLLLRNLLEGIGRSLPPRSTIRCELAAAEDHFDFRFEFVPSTGVLDFTHDLPLVTARLLTQRLGGKILWEPLTPGARVHLKLPKQPAPVETFETQRTSHRVSVTLPVTLKLEGSEAIPSHLRVLSRRGAYLLIPPHMGRPQRDVQGSLRIHHYPGESIEIPRVRVASCLWSGPEPGIGVEFLRLDAKAERILEALIRCHGKS